MKISTPSIHLSLLAGALVAVCTPASLVHAQLPIDATHAQVYAWGLEAPRGLTFGSDGTLYIAEAGTGGSVSIPPTVCPQVPTPIGPYTGGLTARISKVDPHGTQSVLSTGLPSSVDAGGDLQGVADLAFLDGKLYALTAGGGCSHGNAEWPNGIYKVNAKNGKWTLLTDLSVFQLEHPVAYPNAGDYEPDGTWYSMIEHNGRLFAVEPNHGQITATNSDGTTRQIIDISFHLGHVVPTSIADNSTNNNLYVGNLGQFPIEPKFQLVMTLSRDLGFVETVPGLETKPADLNKFRMAASRAGFTTVVSVKFGSDGKLYALELSDAPGYPNPGMGKVVRLNDDGTIVDVVTGLKVPTGMTFGPDGALYISNWGAAPKAAGAIGQVLRIPIPM